VILKDKARIKFQQLRTTESDISSLAVCLSFTR